jgi:uncharacterized membrane protein
MKPVKQVIRIEHPDDNLGIFRSTRGNISFHSCYDAIRKRHNDESKYPNYFRDKELHTQVEKLEGEYSAIQHYRFAFHSLEVLNEAFTREELIEVIQDLGFKVYILEVSNWIESQYQVIFKPENIVNRKDISFMFI